MLAAVIAVNGMLEKKRFSDELERAKDLASKAEAFLEVGDYARAYWALDEAQDKIFHIKLDVQEAGKAEFED